MAYTPTYVIGDVSAIVIDLIGSLFSALVSNVTIIVTLIVLGFVIFHSRSLMSGFWGFLGGFR